MKSKSKSAIKFPKVVDHAKWQKARDALLVKEKAATHARDALAAERRRLPMVRIDKKYTFDGSEGKMSLLDLFEGRRQLLLYHFMFAPAVKGWPDAGCVGCSMVTDQFGHLAHFHARDTSFCLLSCAPLKNIEKYKKRMGWTYPWYSSDGSDFNVDMGLLTDNYYGLSVFIHDDKDIYRSYFTDGRGIEGQNIWTFLDLTPLGRQEEWQDSPAGGPRTKAAHGGAAMMNTVKTAEERLDSRRAILRIEENGDLPMKTPKNIDVLFVAGFGPIVRDPEASRKFYREALGLPFKEDTSGYLHTGELDGVKHFALWPLAQAAESCFGTDHWTDNLPVPQAWIEFDVENIEKATAELKSQGYKLLVAMRKEPWGQVVTRLLGPEGLLVGITHTPSMRK